MDENSQQSLQQSYKGNVLQHNKAIDDKPTTNFVFNGEKLKIFPLRSGTRKGCPLFPLLFSIVWEDIEQLSKKKK